MNRDEQLAYDYLIGLGLGEPVYEPDGEVPPDFLLAGTKAVEVRRLSQHTVHDGEVRSLEQDAIPLRQRFQNLLAEFEPRDGRTWFALYNYRRPLPDWPSLRQLLRATLAAFLRDPMDQTLRLQITDRFTITLHQSTDFLGSAFVYGGHTDFDQGGWVVSEIIENLGVYVPEKTATIAPHRSKYPTWWLLFVDYIGTPDEKDEVRRYCKRPPEWDRIIVLNHTGKAYDI